MSESLLSLLDEASRRLEHAMHYRGANCFRCFIEKRVREEKRSAIKKARDRSPSPAAQAAIAKAEGRQP